MTASLSESTCLELEVKGAQLTHIADCTYSSRPRATVEVAAAH
jgi:hypothetical protein